MSPGTPATLLPWQSTRRRPAAGHNAAGAAAALPSPVRHYKIPPTTRRRGETGEGGTARARGAGGALGAGGPTRGNCGVKKSL